VCGREFTWERCDQTFPARVRVFTRVDSAKGGRVHRCEQDGGRSSIARRGPVQTPLMLSSPMRRWR
jgi:hypothetical protein